MSLGRYETETKNPTVFEYKTGHVYGKVQVTSKTLTVPRPGLSYGHIGHVPWGPDL